MVKKPISVASLKISPVADDDIHPDATLVIEFEDSGQDFLKWQLNSEGVVVKSIPFQTDIWKDTSVRLAELHIGDTPNIIWRDGTPMELKYKVENVYTV